MSKRTIRAQFLAERKSCPVEICVGSSMEIQKRFLLSNWFRDADRLALYSAIHNEVLTEAVSIRALEAGKTLAYPRVKDNVLEFVEVLSRDDLIPGLFGVLEPRGHKLVPIETLDIIVVPGVVFDRKGHRLGYGRGFYDRTLAACRNDCTKVGFAYNFQLVASLPVAAYDQALSILMTESCTLNFTD